MKVQEKGKRHFEKKFSSCEHGAERSEIVVEKKGRPRNEIPR